MSSTSTLLTRVLLRFNDYDLAKIYRKEKSEFFSKSIPVVTVMLMLLAGALEVMYNVLDMGTMPKYISMVNWGCVLLFLLIACLHSRCTWLQVLVCPGLTFLTFFYLCYLDGVLGEDSSIAVTLDPATGEISIDKSSYDYTWGSLYYS